MEIITSIVNWIFSGSIYGVAIIAGAVYLLGLAFKRVIPKVPDPAIFGGLAFVIALLTLPSIPRYQFERQALSLIQGKGWIRVMNKTTWGSMTEPLTWFNAPIGSMYIVMPNNPIEGGFREVLMRYEEEPQVAMIDPDCADMTIMRSRPDTEGVFRYTSKSPEDMTEKEISLYCEYNWAEEKTALREEMQLQNGSN